MKSLLTLAVLFFSILAKAQITVYDTYEDFLNDKGGIFEDVVGSMHIMGSISLFFEDKAGKRSTINCKKIWGFKYKEHIFRTDKNGQYAMLIQKGKICYYENGPAHVGMLRANTNQGTFTLGYECYYSNNLNSDIVVCPVRISLVGRAFKRFQEDNPKHLELYNCIRIEGRTLETIRQCTAEYNKN